LSAATVRIDEIAAPGAIAATVGPAARRWVALIVTLLLVSFPGAALKAQGSGAAALERAIASYRNLEYAAAASQLEALLAPASAGRLGEGLRVRALMYLGATEVFRDRRPAAHAAFTELLLLDPAYRPDDLIFPPEVSQAFGEARRSVHAVGVIVPDSVIIGSPRDMFPLRLHASTPHDLRVMVVDARGSPLRLLHDGLVGDSLELRWNGRDASGRLHASGEYIVEITSSAAPGAAPGGAPRATPRVVLVPLRLDRITRDTLLFPAQPVFTRRPESIPGERRLTPLIAGLVGAAAVVALPSVIGPDAEGMPVRFAVSGALAIGGVAGLRLSMKPRPIPENVQWNRAQLADWQREVARVRAENEAIRAAARLRISARSPRVLPPAGSP
jgi:hypothetical protein